MSFSFSWDLRTPLELSDVISVDEIFVPPGG